MIVPFDHYLHFLGDLETLAFGVRPATNDYSHYKGWVALDENNLLIGACLYKTLSQNSWNFSILMVDPNHRKKGYGSILLEHLTAAANNANVSVSLRAYRGLPYLLCLYSKYGFVLQPGTENSIGSPIMTREPKVNIVDLMY